MGTDGLRRRVIEARRRLAQDGPLWTRPHERDFDTVTLPAHDCDALRDLLVAERAATVVEIGLAYGSSALAIGEALLSVEAAPTDSTPRAHHVVVDPFQDSAYNDVGWDLLRATGLNAFTELVREPSSVALARMVADGFTADAAFVDGSHRFHEVFVDLYFLRKIVRPGGIVVMDDDWAPSVHTAARYFEANLGWTTFDGRTRRCRALRLPDAVIEPDFRDFVAF
jgi:predicted O-methyltransferase YrrM